MLSVMGLLGLDTANLRFAGRSHTAFRQLVRRSIAYSAVGGTILPAAWWLQLTGGEPLIDPLFAETHAAAWDMGMMIQISSNGSRLDRPRILELLTSRRPYRLTLIAERFGIESFEYANISPTIHGGGEVLPSQSREMLRTRKPYTGCNAGITHFHVDPHGKASICKVGRDPQVDLVTEGANGLRRLAAAADSLLTQHGGCSGCTLQKTCGTCMPLANLYRQAAAPLEVFCQHGGR